MKKLLFALLLLASTQAHAAIVTKEIPYKDGSVELTGYLAYDDAIKSAPGRSGPDTNSGAGTAPGILVIHEWWGHNDYARMRADMLAKLGYVAFALDMYGKGVTADNPDDATKLSKPFYDDRKLMRSRALAGLEVLKAQPNVDTSNLGIIGYCFGGSTALELARAGTDVKAIVSFHGGLATTMPAKAGDVKAHVLTLNGSDDKFVSNNEKMDFLKEMTMAQVNFRSIEYPGATHAFTNPKATEMGEKFKLPIAYNKEADEKSWAEMQSFYYQTFSESEAADFLKKYNISYVVYGSEERKIRGSAPTYKFLSEVYNKDNMILFKASP